MTVEITAEDIAAGARRNPDLNPVALACSRAYRQRCSVRPGGVPVLADGRRVDLPWWVACALQYFDRGGKMFPAAFKV